MHLTNSISIPTNIIIYAASYSNSSPHYAPSMPATLSLPIPKSAQDLKDVIH
jgi:dimethylaniline monooxygenase (N-oxide forming)